MSVRYLPGHEVQKVGSRLRVLAVKNKSKFGMLPLAVTVLLPPDDEGAGQDPVSFALVQDPKSGVVYESTDTYEVAGTPAQKLQFSVKEW